MYKNRRENPLILFLFMVLFGEYSKQKPDIVCFWCHYKRWITLFGNSYNYEFRSKPCAQFVTYIIIHRSTGDCAAISSSDFCFVKDY